MTPSAAQARAALAAHGVDLVDEHDGGGVLLGLVKQVVHAARADAHEHLHEVRAGDGEEGHPGLAGHGAGQQGLARAGRAHQQYARGDARAHLGEALGVFQKLYDLPELFLFLVGAGHVVEGDLVAVGVGHAGPGLAEAHHALAAAGLLAHQEVPQRAEEHHGDQLGGDVEFVLRGADLAAQHAFIDGADVGIELGLAGEDAGDVVVAGQLVAGLVLLGDAHQRVGLYHHRGEAHALLLLGKGFALAVPEVGLHPLQQRGIADGLGLCAGAVGQHVHHQQYHRQQQQVHQRPLKDLAQGFLVQNGVPLFRKTAL